MKIAYINHKFQTKALDIIEKANNIIEEYQADGMNLTLRQLYYQFVTLGFCPNISSEYNRLGSIISRARLAGLIDWNAIVDLTREKKSLQSWEDPGQIVRAASHSFKLDHWEGQTCYVEVWIEKEALVGVIQSICQKLDVGYFACKGFVSQSEMWSAFQRLIDEYHNGRDPVIIHLGDHDPSGIDMTRDIEDRLNLFFDGDCYGCPAPEVVRIALNMDQIEELTPPPNPAKSSDSRFKNYAELYGKESWELDALEPRYLRDLIAKEVHLYRDDDIYFKVIEKEAEYKGVLKKIEENWETLI